jgi:hypothetical protein
LRRMNSTLTGRTLRELPWAYSERSAVGGSRDSQSADDAACGFVQNEQAKIETLLNVARRERRYHRLQ